MQKNQNINKIRAIACLLVLIYHCWVLCGSVPVRVPVLRDYIMYGGEIGVTAFFVLSGYGIWSSLYMTELSGSKIAFKPFILKRIKRIVPHYYFNLLVALLFTSAAVYVDRVHIMNILSHLFFFHSFSFSWHGAINGVLWTMSIIFQFYLIAIPLYYFVKKFKHWSVVIAVLFTVIAKYITLNYLWVEDELVYGGLAFFIPGRQLWTALDNFVIGMCAAQIANSRKKTVSHQLFSVGSILCVLLIYLHCLLGNRYGVGGRNIWNCTYYSILALIIGATIICVSNMKSDSKGLISRCLLWISRYEYGIYLWHLLIMNNTLSNSGLINGLVAQQRVLYVYIFWIACSVFTAYVMTTLISGVQKNK